jgi:Leucine-rich repeat (LRR) protein
VLCIYIFLRRTERSRSGSSHGAHLTADYFKPQTVPGPPLFSHQSIRRLPSPTPWQSSLDPALRSLMTYVLPPPGPPSINRPVRKAAWWARSLRRPSASAYRCAATHSRVICYEALTSRQAARGKLDLGGIGMTVVPLEVFKQFDLKALWLHENSLQEIPPEIADLTALTQLRVNNNELRVLPAAVSELKALQVLWLQNNSLAAFPSEILVLTNLTALSVSSNPLLFVPHQLCAITSLRDLHVEGELLTSPPPKTAARGTNAIMEYVDLLDRDFIII